MHICIHLGKHSRETKCTSYCSLSMRDIYNYTILHRFSACRIKKIHSISPLVLSMQNKIYNYRSRFSRIEWCNINLTPRRKSQIYRFSLYIYFSCFWHFWIFYIKYICMMPVYACLFVCMRNNIYINYICPILSLFHCVSIYLALHVLSFVNNFP